MPRRLQHFQEVQARKLLLESLFWGIKGAETKKVDPKNLGGLARVPLERD